MSTNPSPYTGTNIPTGTAGGVLAGSYPNPGLLTGATTGTRYVGGTSGGAPTSGTFTTGDYVIDTTGLIWLCTAGGSPGTWVLMSANGLRETYLTITGTIGEAFPRYNQANQPVTITSQVLNMTSLALPAGQSVGHLSFASATTAASGPTHWWFGLYDNNLNQLATTADQGTNSWASNTRKSLAVATVSGGAASSFLTSYTGQYYAGVMVQAGTTPTLMGCTQVNTTLTSPAPIVVGTSDTGQTTPPAFPHQGTALSAIASPIWAAALT